ncbi:MAG: glycosyltransferase [Syntrophomonadales bacterium]|jgi:glycosyltransferase involved in cell wall biosynthesis
MKKLRVLQVIGGGEIGGAERHLLTLMRLMDREKFTPELLCLCQGPFAGVCRKEGITTHEIVMRHKLDLATVAPIRRLIREQEIDLVHTHGVRANLVARMAGRAEKVPVVTTFHSVLRYDYSTSAEAAVARILTRLTNNRTDRFIAISGAIKEDLAAMGVTPDRIEIIYNGLDVSLLTPGESPDNVKKSLGITPGQRVVAMVGRLHAVKGHIYLLQAAQRIVTQHHDVVFLLVGEGPERPIIENTMRELGLEGRVIMTGFYPNISELYPVMDLLCLPSLMEGMGLVLLEAMHFGVPVVATQVGGIPEVIIDGESGLLVDPGNSRALAMAITWLLDDPGLQQQLITGGRRRAQEFTVEKMVRHTERVYTDLIQGKDKG